MGIFEKFKNLFKSTREKEKEKKCELERKLNEEIEKLNEAIEKLEAEKEKVWASAVKALQGGDRMGADKLLIEYKMIESQIHRLMRYAQTIQNLEKAKLDDTIDNDLMKALEREVAAETAGGDLPAQSISETATVDEQINADLNRLKAQNQEQ